MKNMKLNLLNTLARNTTITWLEFLFDSGFPHVLFLSTVRSLRQPEEAAGQGPRAEPAAVGRGPAQVRERQAQARTRSKVRLQPDVCQWL